MKRLQISPPNFVIKIRCFNIFITIFFGAILLARIHDSKEDAHMEDKELITNAYHSYFRGILEIGISSFLLTKYPERYRIEVLILGGKGDMNN